MARLPYRFQPDVHIGWLVLSVCSVSALGWLTHFTSPQYGIYILIFFILLILTVFGAFFYISNNIRRSLMISAGICIYLLLRILGLRDVYYLALLCITGISLELYFQKQ